MKSAPNVTKSLKAAISEVQNTQTYEFSNNRNSRTHYSINIKFGRDVKKT